MLLNLLLKKIRSLSKTRGPPPARKSPPQSSMYGHWSVLGGVFIASDPKCEHCLLLVISLGWLGRSKFTWSSLRELEWAWGLNAMPRSGLLTPVELQRAWERLGEPLRTQQAPESCKQTTLKSSYNTSVFSMWRQRAAIYDKIFLSSCNSF